MALVRGKCISSMGTYMAVLTLHGKNYAPFSIPVVKLLCLQLKSGLLYGVCYGLLNIIHAL